ncbi:MAG TPA: hypothetical protein VLJ76_03630 [Gaiellaceae bacterium]|nr:hypothetical protein [Gaiellaceae bacterium]
MSKKIAAYVQLLATSAEARAEFKTDPDGAMESFGLSVEEQTVVASGNPDEIRAAVAQVDPDLARRLHIVMG